MAKRREAILPDPEHATVEQVRAYLRQEDEKLSRAQDPGMTTAALGRYTNKNRDELRSYLLENGIKDQARREGSRRRQKGSESEVPINSDSEEPGRPAGPVKAQEQGIRPGRAASSASARPRPTSWEEQEGRSPTDYSRAIGACLNHRLSRMEAPPRPTDSTVPASQMVMAQFQVIPMEMGG